MYLKIIRNKTEYNRVMRRIRVLMKGTMNDLAIDEIGVLAVLAELWEDEQFPIEYPDPIEAIKFRMEQQELSPKDMIKYIGSRSKVSEVLNGKRPLSINMIRKLNEGLSISAEVLIRKG